MRLFVALEIPQTVKAQISSLQEELRVASGTETRWARPENLHVTLKFIGEVANERLAPIREALHHAARQTPARENIALNVCGLKISPNERHARVLWARIAESAKLNALVAAIEHALEPLELAREARKFTPHLTLARFKSSRLPVRLLDAVTRRAEFGPVPFRAGEFQLIESTLKSSGAEYTTLETYRFAAEA